MESDREQAAHGPENHSKRGAPCPLGSSRSRTLRAWPERQAMRPRKGPHARGKKGTVLPTEDSGARAAHGGAGGGRHPLARRPALAPWRGTLVLDRTRGPGLPLLSFAQKSRGDAPTGAAACRLPCALCRLPGSHVK